MNAFSLVFFVLFAAMLALGSAAPTIEEVGQEVKGVDDGAEIEGFGEYIPVSESRRFRRATCDLLSVNTPIGSLNHAACAAHCLAMRKGFRGGRCMNGVCHCRR